MTTIKLDNTIADYRKSYREHVGKCLVNSEKNRLWIEIPKCASKSVSRALLDTKWRDDNWLDNQELRCLDAAAVFRDPLERWIGSTLELAYHHLEHNGFDLSDFDKWFAKQDFYNFDRNLDLHHLPQHVFLLDFPLKNITILDLSRKSFSDDVKQHLGITQLPKLNETQNNEFKKRVKSYIFDMLDTSDLRDKIKEFYRTDYEFLKYKTDK